MTITPPRIVPIMTDVFDDLEGPGPPVGPPVVLDADWAGRGLPVD